MEKKESRQKISNSCGGDREIALNSIDQHYDGFGCTKGEALNAAWDKLIAALEHARRANKCDGECPEGEDCSLLIDEEEDDVATPTYRKVRMSSCPSGVGYRCRLEVKQLRPAIKTTCVCAPGLV